MTLRRTPRESRATAHDNGAFAGRDNPPGRLPHGWQGDGGCSGKEREMEDHSREHDRERIDKPPPGDARGVDNGELRGLVRDYFAMLGTELSGRRVNGSRSRWRLSVAGRGLAVGSDHALAQQRVSGILLAHGLPFIRSLPPRSDYTAELREAVGHYLRNHPEVFNWMETDVFRPVAARDWTDQQLQSRLSEPPSSEFAYNADYQDDPLLIGVDFLAGEQRNRSLSRAGEAFVLEFERQRLRSHGLDKFAAVIEHSSIEHGDGIGYDIQSYALDGSEILIRVKTTRYCRETPFYLSENELAMARTHGGRYWLYRVFDFAVTPRLFMLGGALEPRCSLTPAVYRVSCL